jgi:hypothetical protein
MTRQCNKNIQAAAACTTLANSAKWKRSTESAQPEIILSIDLEFDLPTFNSATLAGIIRRSTPFYLSKSAIH